MLNIVLFGPPGAGKGTQSQKLISKYNLIHLSTGDILRSEIAKSSALGLEAKKFMDGGHLVPDEVVISMIEKKLEENGDVPGYIFDGFPRTVLQASELDVMLEELGLSISAMIALNVHEEELIQRLMKRGAEMGRVDDTLETIHNRIIVYEEKTRPVAEYYAQQQKYYEVDGIGDVENIFKQITVVIDNLGVNSN